jgi:hypothetical protein
MRQLLILVPQKRGPDIESYWSYEAPYELTKVRVKQHVWLFKGLRIGAEQPRVSSECRLGAGLRSNQPQVNQRKGMR